MRDDDTFNPLHIEEPMFFYIAQGGAGSRLIAMKQKVFNDNKHKGIIEVSEDG